MPVDHPRDAIAIVGVAYRLPGDDGRHGEPQQRLLVEVACSALEDAGLRPEAVCGSKTGVYVGVVDADVSEPTGGSQRLFAGRLSEALDLRGPSRTVEAGSASLVTVHYACRDLLDGAADLAIAGVVNVMLASTALEGRLVAAASRLDGFDVATDGEGVGLVVLKRLGDALRDGDRVQAVLSSLDPGVPITELDTREPLEVVAWPFLGKIAIKQSDER